MRGRFAPSPTGRLHLGNARSALLGWLQARAAGGEFALRIEDLDSGRSRAPFVALLEEDLRWLGLSFDGPVLRQSERGPLYAQALRQLEQQGLAYRCTCSRADLARAASAPHEGEDGPVYPGTCREGPTQPDRPSSWRFLTSGAGVVRFVDAVHGPQQQDVEATVGDFVVQRADGVASYQLAVVVDDAAGGITDVLRADDLLGSTARQLLLYRALGYAEPTWAHVPLLLGEDGKRLAKRDGLLTLAGLREAGASPQAVVGLLARLSGLSDGAACQPSDLVKGFSLERVRREPSVVMASELAGLAGLAGLTTNG